MRRDDHHYVTAVLEIRRNLAEILVLAFALALGINLLSSALPSELAMSSKATAVAGAALVLVSVSFLAVRLRRVAGRRLTLEGILALDEHRMPEEVDRYELSEKLNQYFKAISVENKAIAKIWTETPLGLEVDEERRAARNSRSQANLLVLEALEYFVLDKLTLHLSAYFDSAREVDENTVVRVERSDIPQVLLQNRFLELFSKPMEMREAFMDHLSGGEYGRVVYATGADGALFDHFELVLPAKSRVSRLQSTGLSIETPRFHLAVKPEFIGTSALFPSQFEEFYLGRQFNELSLYGVRLHIEVEFKWLSFFTSRGWDYYEWLDSFLDELATAFEFSEFLERINWEAAATVATVLKEGSKGGRGNAG
ncbi:hypothetical protein [Acidovorax radicis]|uniref:hypothetical protein n=1 Tax=Acidovorax radicis TaxID=758826 RepID=UPI001CF8652D|nr:hypothetical protein [Acidovorax radicis]UCU97869.1 hypothetical protein KI609_15050 [Acidovorax radicis]